MTKVTNHKKGNYRHNPLSSDGTVYYGTIKVDKYTIIDWLEYLYLQYMQATKDCDTYKRDSLLRIATEYNGSSEITNKKYLSLGVNATKMIFDKYQLPNYKYQNYLIEII